MYQNEVSKCFETFVNYDTFDFANLQLLTHQILLLEAVCAF